MVDNVYKNFDLDNNLCLLNRVVFSKLENSFREHFKKIGLNVTVIRVESIIKENKSNIYELEVYFDNLEMLYFCLRMNDKVDCGYEIGNTYYSKKMNGIEYYISHHFERSDFLSENIFFINLVRYPNSIINLVNNKSFKATNSNDVKKQIKRKMYNNFV